MKILMVCLGNICRSPLAEGILKSKVSSEVEVDSAGTAGYHEGELPDTRSIAVAKKYGIDITNQRSRKFTVADFDYFDLIYVMDDSNYHNVLSLARNDEDALKVKMILSELGSTANVPDPYYGGTDGFENVYAMLDDACDVISSKM
ncbi:putative Protein-tyrosine-phosphatase [Tenacibaculum litopenaei]|jgi:protein-tyrosine phosphatase|uniref:low molecular weight protein-tyrosine-phosphatase n=1 Tax=Tenacibaculum litopenaei TaxID=396016 RepID=UPI0038941E28